ncbi:jg13649 [Pararge aegeria aegeria]|uniref:Jg13649 protein n=1 Tax=Pararge aegeria aegeria TaxID=348720 RepID=A0A8S4SPC9_9NEOP|nr:jg13649 [Pararge aegeria aegeria]
MKSDVSYSGTESIITTGQDVVTLLLSPIILRHCGASINIAISRLSLEPEILNHYSSTARERAVDARRPSGGNRQSHPVVGGIALTPRYSPRPRLDHVRPAAAPPEPSELTPSVEAPPAQDQQHVPNAGATDYARTPVSTTRAGPA